MVYWCVFNATKFATLIERLMTACNVAAAYKIYATPLRAWSYNLYMSAINK